MNAAVATLDWQALSLAAPDRVLIEASAGTGKTFLAVASAVEALNESRVQRLILVRPAVEAGEKLGFLESLEAASCRLSTMNWLTRTGTVLQTFEYAAVWQGREVRSIHRSRLHEFLLASTPHDTRPPAGRRSFDSPSPLNPPTPIPV